MDEGVRAGAAAREAIDDITPPQLGDLIETRLDEAPKAPGGLTVLTARAATHDDPPPRLDRRTAGVQLIYTGLRLTRTLARTNPWNHDDHRTADLDILAADVLVGRGFYLLAQTDAAAKAVETVQQFGRDETNRAIGRVDPELTDRALEADVFELAVIAGITAAGISRPPGIREFAVELAASFDPRTDSTDWLRDASKDALTALVADRTPPATAPDRSWAGSSITDP